MRSTVTRRELVKLIDVLGAANERRLAPYCERHLRSALGDDWIAAVARRRAAEGRPALAADAGPFDPRFVLACLAYEREFAELGQPAQKAARELGGIANKAFHHDASKLSSSDLDRARALLRSLQQALPRSALGPRITGAGGEVLGRLVGGPIWHGPLALLAGVAAAFALIELAGLGETPAELIGWVVIVSWCLVTRTVLWGAIAVAAYLLLTG